MVITANLSLSPRDSVCLTRLIPRSPAHPTCWTRGSLYLVSSLHHHTCVSMSESVPAFPHKTAHVCDTPPPTLPPTKPIPLKTTSCCKISPVVVSPEKVERKTQDGAGKALCCIRVCRHLCRPWEQMGVFSCTWGHTRQVSKCH